MKIEIDVPDKLIDDTLASAGIRYWCASLGYEMAHGMWIAIPRDDEHNERRYTRVDIARALRRMALEYPKHFADLVGRTGDAITGDILIQLAAFDEVRYA